MQIKQFEAKDMTQGLRMVKKEFGADAVILSAKTIRKTGRFLGTTKETGVVITAATDPIQNGISEKLNAYVKAGSNMPDAPNKKESIDPTQLLKGTMQYTSDKTPDPEPSEPPKTYHSPGIHAVPGVEVKKSLNLLKGRLLSQGIENQITKEIIAEIGQELPMAGRPSDRTIRKVFSDILRQKHMIADPIHKVGKKAFTAVLAGPTGVGKTTSTVKLALHYKMDKNYQVGIISLDHYRIAATASLMTYSNITGIPFEVVSNAQELKKILKSMRKMDLILIDTPGLGLMEKKEMARISGMMDVISPDQVYLVLSATMKNADLMAYHAFYEPMGFDRLLFTKLDETSIFGNIVNLLAKSKTPLAYLTGGQSVPETIRPVNIETLMDLVLPENEVADDKEHQPGFTRIKAVDTKNIIREESYEFVANRNSDIFHHRECKSVSRIHQDNIIHFSNYTEAMEQNFKPCRMCCMDNIDPKLIMKPLKRAAQGGY